MRRENPAVHHEDVVFTIPDGNKVGRQKTHPKKNKETTLKNPPQKKNKETTLKNPLKVFFLVVFFSQILDKNEYSLDIN